MYGHHAQRHHDKQDEYIEDVCCTIQDTNINGRT